MRRLFFIVTAVIMIAGMIIIQSCGKDDDSAPNEPVPNAFVVVERNTGKIFQVNKSTGAITELGQIKLASGEKIINIRGMVYRKSNKTLYVATGDDGGGSFYTVDLSTKQATILNENPDRHWYGVEDLLLSSDKLIASVFFEEKSDVGQGPGLLTLDIGGTVSDQKLFSDSDICCGMGISFGNSNNEILIASVELQIYKSDLSGAVELEATLVPEGFEPTEVGENYYIESIVKDSGKLYAIAIIIGNTYLAEIDLANKKLIHICQLNAKGTFPNYHGLVLIPSDRL